MRIISGFVTNSSSSSFVIAMKKDTKLEELKNHIKSCLEDLKEYSEFEDLYENENDYYGFEGKKDATREEQINHVAEYLAEDIYGDAKYGLDLGEYRAWGDEYGTENSWDFKNWFFYYGINKENPDVLKIKAFS